MIKHSKRLLVTMMIIPLAVGIYNVNSHAASTKVLDPSSGFSHVMSVDKGKNKNGFVKGSDGNLYYYKNGSIDKSKTDVIKNTNDGKWYNVVNGKVTAGPTVAKNNNGWFYIDKNGRVDFKFEGFASNKNGTFYLKHGEVDFSVTEVIKNKADGKWYNVVNAKVTPGPTVAKNSNGWFYIDKNGRVDFNFEGFASNKYGTFYLKHGEVDFSVTNVIKNKADGKWYNVVNAKVTPGPAIAKNSNGWFYIDKNGAVDFKKNGDITDPKNKNIKLTIKNGQVVSKVLVPSLPQSEMTQEEDDGRCCAFSYKIGINIVTGDNVNIDSIFYRGQAHYIYGHVNDMIRGLSNNQLCSKIYDSLMNGMPVMINYNYSGGEHWVLINGFKNVNNNKNLSFDNFYCIDPVYGSQRVLTNAFNWDSTDIDGIKIFR